MVGEGGGEGKPYSPSPMVGEGRGEGKPYSPSPMVGEGRGEGKKSLNFKEERDFHSGATFFRTSGRFFRADFNIQV